MESNASAKKKDTELSGISIVILIGASVMTFIILFIFAKRQIMRFTLRSRPWHVGYDAKKVSRFFVIMFKKKLSYIFQFQSIKREIERRLDVICNKIAYEPTLLWDDSKFILKPDSSVPPYYYRQKAVDDVKLLGKLVTN
jgi:hypothetical protein